MQQNVLVAIRFRCCIRYDIGSSIANERIRFPKAVEAGKAIPYWDVFGLHINQVGYQGQVLPMLVAAYILASIEKGYAKLFQRC